MPVVPQTTPPGALSVESAEVDRGSVSPALTKPHLYEIGSSTGCACGFDRELANLSHPEELQATESSLDALGNYLQASLQPTESAQLFACWDGDEALEPLHLSDAEAPAFQAGMAWFPERSLIVVRRRAA